MKLALRLAVVALVLVAGASLWWSLRRVAKSEVALPPSITAERADDAAPHEPLAAPLAHAPSPEVDSSTREAVAAPPASVSAPPPTAPLPPELEDALLRVRVVSKERGEPVGGQRLLASPKGGSQKMWKHVEGSRAERGEIPRTDEDGRAELALSPHLEHELLVTSRSQHPSVDVPALAAGQVHELVLEIATEADLTFFGRLIDADTGSALAGGVVRFDAQRRIEASNEPDVVARADGTFELSVRSWEQRFASAVAPGHARVVFAIEMGHETAAEAAKVRLSRAAVVEVVVLDNGLPTAEAKVSLSTDAYHLQPDGGMAHFYWSSEDPSWEAVTDAAGRAELGELPPRVPLTLSVKADDREPRTEATPVVLEPGERRRIEVQLASGATITGRVQGPNGEPVAGCEVWLVATSTPLPALLKRYEKPAATARSDPVGHFRIEHIPKGIWLIGPSPAPRNPRDDADTTIALAQPVQVDEWSSQIDVLIRIDHGLFLKGVVVGPDGRAAPECHVFASMEGARAYENDATDGEGRFSLGPLPAGLYTLTARGMLGAFAPSEPVTAQAGGEPIVLHVRLGGSIRGKAVDASGNPRECEVTLAPAGGGQAWMATSTAEDGTFELDGLLPATYSLTLVTSAGLCGRSSGLRVGSGEALDGIEVVLQPGARLTLRYTGAEPHCSFSLVADGEVLGGDGVERGGSNLRVVPAGEIEVRWSAPTAGAATVAQRVTLAPGEEREIVWDGRP